MSTLSRTAALSATVALAFAGQAGAADLQPAPKTLKQPAPMTMQAQPMTKKPVEENKKKDDADKKAPQTLKPQLKAQPKPTGKPSPGSAPGPTPKSMPTLKAPPKAIQTRPGLKPGPEVKPQLKRGCPDPAITELRPGWPMRNDDGTYSFKLLATIKNVGDAHYRSKNTQQSLTLKEGNRELKTDHWPDRTFHPDYAPGEAGSIVHAVQNWNPNSEFLADFTAHLTYDPDITMDGNPENDDCNNTNNTARLSVAELKRILSSLP